VKPVRRETKIERPRREIVDRETALKRMKALALSAEKYPRGWNEARVRRVLEYYESQSDEEAAAEIETAFESTTMEVPVALVPEVRLLIAKRKQARPTKKQNITLQPRSRAQRSKAQRNSRAARG
jgi:hypothetical protein